MRGSLFSVLMLALAYSLVLVSCAKTGSLTGGPLDKTPPALIAHKSTPNYQTNFSEREIIFVFDEFIELKSLDQNLLISPPMFDLPKIKQRGKKITITIPKEEVLREDATYTIDLGEAIVDYNAGNKLEGFKFVFATGDKLDSLSMSGKVIDAYTEEPVEAAYFMLYDILTDSIVAEERPFYLVKTDSEGKFKLENLKSDTFKMIALDDLNFNYMYDMVEEGIGYSDSLIVLTDSSALSPEIKISYAKRPPRLMEKNYRTYGQVFHLYDQDITKEPFQLLYPEDWNYVNDTQKDTLRLWYTDFTDSLSFTLGLDTTWVRLPSSDTTFTNSNIGLLIPDSELAPWDTLSVKVTDRISQIDTSLITLYTLTQVIDSVSVDSVILDSSFKEPILGDTLLIDSSIAVIDTIVGDTITSDTLMPPLDTLAALRALEYDTTYLSFTTAYELNKMLVRDNWLEGSKYNLDFLPGAITDVHGRVNDSLSLSFEVLDSASFGEIIVQVSDLNDSLSYVLQLMEGERIVKTILLKNTVVDSVRYSQVPVGSYSLILIEDRDEDGLWSPVDYWQGLQPELIRRFELDKMQPNFDLEAKISWIEKIPAPPPSEEGDIDERAEEPDDKRNPLNGRKK